MSRHSHRFFVEQPLSPNSQLVLSPEQSSQITSVLRLRDGDRIDLFDGSGHDFDAVILDANRAGVRVDIVSAHQGVGSLGPTVELALALIKNDRFEWVVQKATELGVNRIIPMKAEHSVVSLRVDREERRRERWRKISIEASEQCGRSDVPRLDAVTSFADVVNRGEGARVILLWEDEESVLLPTLPLDRDSPVRLVIGPEGGFTEAELASARQAGVTTASLGPLTLRSETAAVAAVAMLATRALSGEFD